MTLNLFINPTGDTVWTGELLLSQQTRACTGLYLLPFFISIRDRNVEKTIVCLCNKIFRDLHFFTKVHNIYSLPLAIFKYQIIGDTGFRIP